MVRWKILQSDHDRLQRAFCRRSQGGLDGVGVAGQPDLWDLADGTSGDGNWPGLKRQTGADLAKFRHCVDLSIFVGGPKDVSLGLF